MKTKIHINNCLKLILISGALTSCGSVNKKDSTNISEDRIYQRYSAIYDTDSNGLYFGAQYNIDDQNGAAIKLSDLSKVSINRNQMVYSNNFHTFNVFGVSTYFYSHPSSGNENQNLEFEWTQVSGSSIKNTVDLGTPIEITNITDNQEINDSEDIKIEFTGAEQAAEIQCRFTVYNDPSENEPKRVVFVFGIQAINKSSCFLATSALKTLREGNADLTVVRTTRRSLNTEDEGTGDMLGQYISKSIPVTIVRSTN